MRSGFKFFQNNVQWLNLVFSPTFETPGPTPSSRVKSKELPSLKWTSNHWNTKLINVPILIFIHLFNEYALPVLSHFFTTHSCQNIFNIILPSICTFHNGLSPDDFWRSLASVTDSAFKYLPQTIPWLLQSTFYRHVLFPHIRHISHLSRTSFNNLRVERLLRIAWRQRDGLRWLSRHAEPLRAKRSEDRIPVKVRSSAPVQSGPEDHPASYTTGTESFSGVKWPGFGVHHPHPSSAEFKERVQLLPCHYGRSQGELYLYFYLPSERSGSSVHTVTCNKFWKTGKSEFNFLSGGEIVSFSTSSWPALGDSRCVPAARPPPVKRLVTQAAQTPITHSTKFKNPWKYTTTPSDFFVVIR
jgi:hypothetical protein